MPYSPSKGHKRELCKRYPPFIIHKKNQGRRMRRAGLPYDSLSLCQAATHIQYLLPSCCDLLWRIGHKEKLVIWFKMIMLLLFRGGPFALPRPKPAIISKKNYYLWETWLLSLFTTDYSLVSLTCSLPCFFDAAGIKSKGNVLFLSGVDGVVWLDKRMKWGKTVFFF